MRLLAVPLLALAAAADGCSTQGDPSVPVQPVSIKADTFCSVMKKVAPPSGKLTWSTRDTPETVYQIRRLDAVVDAKRCSSPPASS